MRPRGPLPPRVYWTRRLLLVAVIMVVGALLWWVMPGVGGSGNAAANPGGGPGAAQQPSTPGSHPTATQSTDGEVPPGEKPAVTNHPTPEHGSGTTSGPGESEHPTKGHPTNGQPTKGQSTP